MMQKVRSSSERGRTADPHPLLPLFSILFLSKEGNIAGGRHYEHSLDPYIFSLFSRHVLRPLFHSAYIAITLGRMGGG